MPLKPFWCIFIQSKSTKCEIFAWNFDFQEPLIIETWNPCAIGFNGTPWTLNMYHSSNFVMHFSQSKSTKCEIFASNFDFSGTTYHRDSKPVPLDSGMPWTLNMHHSSHFSAFFPLKINKMWNFWLFTELPLTKEWKKCQFQHGKSVWSGLKICTYRFLCMLITMHYVRTLCDKYFLSYDGFFFLICDRKV